VKTGRLPDCVGSDVDVLFVGINPGMRSAAIGHHFAGYSNRFWRLMYEAGVVPERIGPLDDRRLPEWRMGLTNLIDRATPGIDTLGRDEYGRGAVRLRRKVRRWKPRLVVLIGVSLYRVLFDARAPIHFGLQEDRLEGARVFLLPNPSGRNAHVPYAAMKKAFRLLARELARPGDGRRT
jgi:TDG/mug DNA glycosylase family protein